MIKGLMGQGNIVVSGGNTSVPYVNQNSSNGFQGIMRINGSDIQYHDNGMWNNVGTSYATVQLTGETETLLQWVRLKKAEEDERSNLAKSHPAVAKALNAVKKAEEQLDLVVKLSKEHGETVETS